MLLNQIQFPDTINTDAEKIAALKVLAFADDILVMSPAAGDIPSTDDCVAKCRFLPEGVVFGFTKTAFQLVVRRQDAKSVALTPLSVATVGQGMVVNETQFGSDSETYFSNSYRISTANQTFRVGVSNFTQTLDNNPFDALTAVDILYYQLD